MLKMSCIIRQGRTGFLGIYGIQGLFKSGIRYIAVKRRVFGLSLSLNFRSTVYNASINFGYVHLDEFWVFWRFFFGYTGITLTPVFSPTSAHLCKRKI